VQDAILKHHFYGIHRHKYRQISIVVCFALAISIMDTGSYAFAAEAPHTAPQIASSPQHALADNAPQKLAKYHQKRNNTDTTLTFDDEFNETSLDTSMWNIEDYGTGKYQNCCLKFGLQYYTEQAISLNNGSLRITSNNTSMGNKSYTSGALTTENKFSFLYGRVDIRARLAAGQGIWPALWMLDSNATHEIDLLETINNSTNVYQTYHAIDSNVTSTFQCIVPQQNLSTEYHVYSLVWYPSYLAWYIDNVQTCLITTSIPSNPMYLLLNTAVGGSWPGPPDATTVFPQYTDIDYVQVSQTPPLNYCYGFLVSTPLQLDTTTIPQGGTVNGTVTYTNNCTNSFTINNLIIAARASDGTNADFPNRTGALTLSPGQSISLSASRLIKSTDPPGQWFAFSSFQTPDGKWHADGTNTRYFTVTT
jgi:beta-glucanase (GH16 family)